MGNPSFATVNPANTLLTPCRVTFKGIDLGGTLGNVKIGFETAKAELKMDQLGEGPIDRVISKQMMTVEFEITEVRLKDNWKVVFPHMHLITSGINKAIYSDSQIGRRDQDDAGLMVLHPLALANSDKSGDHNFYKMISDAASEIVYGPGEQVKLKFKGLVLPDFSVQPVRYYFHGDTTVGLIAAVAATPTYVGTGDGTMSAPVVYSGATITETITAIYDGALWIISGSTTGIIGTVATGSAFVSGKISFTITAGSTPFIATDTFTILTTAANYV